MKKTTNWMLTALLAMGLSMGFIACSDDDDDNSNGGVPTNEAEYKEAGLGWDIITQLTAERTAPEGWESMTFEPTIGKASEADPYTRVVATNDVAAAAERFSGLVGLPDLISETTTSFTYNQEGMGKLTYQMGSVGGQYLAQVDVDLKQVPHLKKILYQTPEQMGNNSYFDGTAYYRFGDVVMDKDGYYWICVRPAFGPEGKEDSHWMCLSHNLPDGNIKEYKTSTGIQDYIPTGLGKSTEHMQNTAEMFYAMLHPSDWVNALSLSTKPKMFNDFSYSNIRFHNMYFWKLVCKAWENENLFNLVLGVDKETLDKDKEWHMLYSGYSWWFTTSWNCSLYEVTFKNGKGKKSNMHEATYTSPTKDMHDITLDAKSGSKVGTVSGPFFDNDNKLRWYARYKKGSELGGGAYNVKTQINGCTDVYVYNRHYYQNTQNNFYNMNLDPEITKEDDDIVKEDELMYGYILPGTILCDEEGSNWLCYYAWSNLEDGGSDVKKMSKFISFDNIQTATETIDGTYVSNPEGIFAINSDLIPEREVPLMAFFFYSLTLSNKGEYYDEFRKDIKNIMGINYEDLYAVRDTTHMYTWGPSKGKNYATNYAYIPEHGRQQGTQPYMRYINDGSHVGNNRVGDPDNYWYSWLYKRYHVREGQMLDLVDLFEMYNFLTDAVMPDRWSNGVRNGTDYRDDAFLLSDRYEGTFDVRKFFYDMKSSKWPSVIHNNGYTRPEYVSAYWEPVLFVRFREFKDVDNKFTGKYGDHRYIMMNNPDRKNQIATLVQCNVGVDILKTHCLIEDNKVSIEP